MAWLKFICFVCLSFQSANAFLEVAPTPSHKMVLNQQLFKDVLDPKLCERQMTYMRKNNTKLLAKFLDTGYRTPHGLLGFNSRYSDLGKYFQCLGIKHETKASTIQGKYCTITLPISQNKYLPILLTLPQFLNVSNGITTDLTKTLPKLWPNLFPENLGSPTEFLKMLSLFRMRLISIERIIQDDPLSQMLSFEVGVCLPKSCSIRQFFDIISPLRAGLQYDERYCRLPKDKQWAAADFIAIAIFSLLGLLVGLCTAYELHSIFVLKEDPRNLNTLGLSFSALSNSRRLLAYVPMPDSIECLDGLRTLAMMWIIMGHTFINQLIFPISNKLDIGEWVQTSDCIWIVLAPINVDTFLMISGLLVVYSTAGKWTRMNLLQNLHLFYLNRLLRLLPMLAAWILLQASLLSKVADGPYWDSVIDNTEKCRTTWWATLLHVQNWLYPNDSCLSHTWYLAINFQLYIISPIILFWVLGNRKSGAWVALVAALLAVLTLATIYNFKMQFPSWIAQTNRPFEDTDKYQRFYYKNTLPRASPFFVGMVYGYLLHTNRRKDVCMSKIYICALWALTFAVFGTVTHETFIIMQAERNDQYSDSLLNSFKSPAWACAVGWLVFACHNGYAGPINWFLSLRIWKLPSRLSYAMCIIHYGLRFFIDASVSPPDFFSVNATIAKFFADFGLTLVVSYILTILVEAPLLIIFQQFKEQSKKSYLKIDCSSNIRGHYYR